jgi:hypothetical protein
LRENHSKLSTHILCGAFHCDGSSLHKQHRGHLIIPKAKSLCQKQFICQCDTLESIQRVWTRSHQGDSAPTRHITVSSGIEATLPPAGDSRSLGLAPKGSDEAKSIGMHIDCGPTASQRIQRRKPHATARRKRFPSRVSRASSLGFMHRGQESRSAVPVRRTSYCT